MFLGPTSARADTPSEGRPVRVSPDDLKGGNIQKAVLKDCLQENLSLFPWAGGVAVVMVGAVSLSPVVLAAGVGLFFVGTSAFIYNYVVKGEERAADKVNALRQVRREQIVFDLGDLAQTCQAAGFEDGAQKAVQLQEAYRHILDYLKNKSGVSVEGWIVLAEDTFKQGLATLTKALDMHKAINSVDLKQLKDERKAYARELAKLDAESVRARTLKLSIEDHDKRIALVDSNMDQLAELLQHADEIEAALQEALLKLSSMGNHDSGDITLDAEGGSAKRLKDAVDSAKRVEDRLRGKTDAEEAALRRQYIDAGR